jgi:sugar phosphate isomerase/epimerase
MTEIGLNLYSLRNCIATEEDFLSTAIRLREMGYTFLQYSGAAFDADRITRVSKESGMPVVLTHVPADRIINETEQLMEEHAKFGCKNIGLGALGMKIIGDRDLCFSKLESLERAAEKMEKNGFSFFYHNHHHEFFKYNGETIFDYMIKNAPHINFTFDTYWAQYGGVSVIEFIEKLKGRIACVHLKDYKIALKEKLVPDFAPVGDGNINFKAIIPKMLEAGAEYFIVEQDNAADAEDPFGEAKRSIDYLKKEF